MLIIVTGLNFGMYLNCVPAAPIHQSVPELRGHIVYTVHEYEWYNYIGVVASDMPWDAATIAAFVGCHLIVLLAVALISFRRRTWQLAEEAATMESRRSWLCWLSKCEL